MDEIIAGGRVQILYMPLWGGSCRVPLSHPANCESQSWNDDPLQHWSKTGAEPREHWHNRAIRPVVPDLDVQPFAENRVGDTKDNRHQHHPETERTPTDESALLERQSAV